MFSNSSKKIHPSEPNIKSDTSNIKFDKLSDVIDLSKLQINSNYNHYNQENRYSQWATYLESQTEKKE